MKGTSVSLQRAHHRKCETAFLFNLLVMSYHSDALKLPSLFSREKLQWIQNLSWVGGFPLSHRYFQVSHLLTDGRRLVWKPRIKFLIAGTPGREGESETIRPSHLTDRRLRFELDKQPKT